MLASLRVILLSLVVLARFAHAESPVTPPPLPPAGAVPQEKLTPPPTPPAIAVKSSFENSYRVSVGWITMAASALYTGGELAVGRAFHTAPSPLSAELSTAWFVMPVFELGVMRSVGGACVAGVCATALFATAGVQGGKRFGAPEKSSAATSFLINSIFLQASAIGGARFQPEAPLSRASNGIAAGIRARFGVDLQLGRALPFVLTLSLLFERELASFQTLETRFGGCVALTF